MLFRSAISSALGRVPAPLTRLAIGGLSSGPIERRLGHVARMGRGQLNNRLLPPTIGAHLPTQVLDSAAIARLRTSTSPAQAEDVASIRARLAQGLDHLNRTQLAFNGNGLNGQSKVKVEIGLARGRKGPDKRHAIAERDAAREVAREQGRRRKGMG